MTPTHSPSEDVETIKQTTKYVTCQFTRASKGFVASYSAVHNSLLCNSKAFFILSSSGKIQY